VNVVVNRFAGGQSRGCVPEAPCTDSSQDPSRQLLLTKGVPEAVGLPQPATEVYASGTPTPLISIFRRRLQRRTGHQTVNRLALCGFNRPLSDRNISSAAIVNDGTGIESACAMAHGLPSDSISSVPQLDWELPSLLIRRTKYSVKLVLWNKDCSLKSVVATTGNW